MLNVLIAGAGGNVSQGILKALALSSLSCHTVAACIDPLGAGLFAADTAYVSPLANAPEFLPWLLQVCRRERVDAILSGVEPVLTCLSEYSDVITRETGAIPIVSLPEQLAVANHKLRTCEWLRDRGFEYPFYADSGDRPAIDALLGRTGFPILAKPLFGKGGEGVRRIDDESGLARIAGKPGYVVQEYLGSDDSEFTVACICDKTGNVRGCITMHRQLLHGTTYRAEVCVNPIVSEQAIAIARELRPIGPVNIQMRMHRGRAVCFEINLRFSGTTPMRARFGFNDVEFALRHFVLGEAPADLPVVTSGIALRYWNEMYVDPVAVRQLRASSELPDARSYKLTVEDYGMR